ncbi:hypothetical protein N7539_005418 [Penicillium diatomitis]|uniref:Uncharacterized protein n=1 Tax=Penicillium diatomitis TaxID=2819901 RepID=A0A9X0BV98_9EURO|nr:uncharacterized protein N7539_005418 [Penicillium diatomitis]KAJ5485430.1 hypothetical protein N7539_005418 [Penicillium diatomitis]
MAGGSARMESIDQCESTASPPLGASRAADGAEVEFVELGARRPRRVSVVDVRVLSGCTEARRQFAPGQEIEASVSNSPATTWGPRHGGAVPIGLGKVGKAAGGARRVCRRYSP